MGILRPRRECEQNTFAFEAYMINVKFSGVLSEGQRNTERGGFESADFSLVADFKEIILK